jgi:hypothetical protein
MDLRLPKRDALDAFELKTMALRKEICREMFGDTPIHMVAAPWVVDVHYDSRTDGYPR